MTLFNRRLLLQSVASCGAAGATGRGARAGRSPLCGFERTLSECLATSQFDPERTSSSERTRCRRSAQSIPSPMPAQGTPMTDRDKILIALREKPLKIFEIMKRVNIKHQDDCQSLLLKMRDDGAVKFDIHKGHWLAS
jgi:hypothetical protein